MNPLQTHWKHYWPYWIIFFFVIFQFGDVLFGDGTLNTLPDSPAACVYEIPKYHGWLEGGSLNRFPRQDSGARALWDRPMVLDPNIKASNDMILSGEFPWILSIAC